MMNKLTNGQQQLLAVALLVAIVAAALLLTIIPVWQANAALQAEISVTQQQLRALRTQAEAGERLKPRLEQLRRSQLTAGHYLSSNTEAVAAAELQGLIKSIASGNSTEILSTQILPLEAEQGFPRVALRVRMRGTLVGLVQSFYDIESHPTFLFMDRVLVRDRSRRRGNRQRVNDRFDTDLDLIAYMPEPEHES